MVMKILGLNIATLILRFYLLMAIVIIAGFTGVWWLALLALPVFVSALLGISFSPLTRREGTKTVRQSKWIHSQAKSH
jgi:hypothetical protein